MYIKLRVKYATYIKLPACYDRSCMSHACFNIFGGNEMNRLSSYLSVLPPAYETAVSNCALQPSNA